MYCTLQCADLEDNRGRVLMLSEERERVKREQQIEIEKTRRDTEAVKKKLEKERALKLDAFQTVNALRMQVVSLLTVMFCFYVCL